MGQKTLHNSDTSGTHKNVKDVQTFGNPDMFKLLCKASSQEEGWMKSTKVLEIPGLGCIVQTTTQQGENVAEAMVYVPGACLAASPNPEKRRLISIKQLHAEMEIEMLSADMAKISEAEKDE
jgi:hypothetical protein